MTDPMFTLNGMAAKAIAAKDRGTQVTLEPDQVLEVSAAVRVMRESIRSAIKDCAACSALGELVTDRCPRCRQLAGLLGGEL